MDGHVIESGLFISGEDDVGAATSQPAGEGQDAEEEVAAGVVNEDDGLVVRCEEEAVDELVEIVDEPGAGREAVTDVEEVEAIFAVCLCGCCDAHVEDIACEDALDDGVDLIRAVQGVKLAADGREELEHLFVFAVLPEGEGVEEPGLAKELVAPDVEGEDGHAAELPGRGVKVVEAGVESVAELLGAF